MTQAAVQAGAPRREVEERRRSVVLFLIGLAAAILVFWTEVVSLVPGGVGNVIAVGYNGTQKFYVWASPGSVVRWDVVFCNAVDSDVSVVVKVVEVPKEVRRFLFYINGTKFGWDGVSYTEWHTLFRPRTCLPGKLEIVIDSHSAKDAVHLVKMEITSHLQS